MYTTVHARFAMFSSENYSTSLDQINEGKCNKNVKLQ